MWVAAAGPISGAFYFIIRVWDRGVHLGAAHGGEGVWIARSRVIGGYELPGVNAENQTLVLCRRAKVLTCGATPPAPLNAF